MQSLTVQERMKLKSLLKMIESFKNQLIESGFTTHQVQNYFTFIVNDALNHHQKSSQTSNFNQLLTSILSKQTQSILKILRKLQMIFHIQRSSLKYEHQQEPKVGKNSEAISNQIKQKKKEIKEKRKKETKETKDVKKKQQKLTRENSQINKSQTFKFQSTMNINLETQKALNPLKQLKNCPNQNLFNSNQFSTIKPQPAAKNIFVSPQENDTKQEFRKNIFQINFLKNILEKQLMNGMEQQQHTVQGVNGLLDMATLMFRR